MLSWGSIVFWHCRNYHIICSIVDRPHTIINNSGHTRTYHPPGGKTGRYSSCGYSWYPQLPLHWLLLASASSILRTFLWYFKTILGLNQPRLYLAFSFLNVALIGSLHYLEYFVMMKVVHFSFLHLSFFVCASSLSITLSLKTLSGFGSFHLSFSRPVLIWALCTSQ